MSSEDKDNRLPPDIRYQRDATFACLVNTLEMMLRACDYTPTEIREAAMLAAIRHERYRDYLTVTGKVIRHECTCKARTRDHEPGCYWHMKHQENEVRIRMALDFHWFPPIVPPDEDPENEWNEC